jgi:DNA-binding NtrC family response regulator
MSEKKRILLVDDEPELVEELSLILEEEGYEVVSAPDGKQGVDLFRENGFSVVLMDIKMPEMNGLDAFREIIAVKPDAKVIIITGSFAKELSEQAIKEGALSAMYKPFDPTDLLALIDSIIKEE